jgi:hypothetical protein
MKERTLIEEGLCIRFLTLSALEYFARSGNGLAEARAAATVRIAREIANFMVTNCVKLICVPFFLYLAGFQTREHIV